MRPDAAKRRKPPRPKETASLSSIVAERRRAARRKQKTKSLHKRLTDPYFHLRMPGHLFTDEWSRKIGRGTGYQLLGILLKTCDWDSGIWRGNIFALAEVMGVNEKTVRNQLNDFKKNIDDFWVERFPESVAIHMPDTLFQDGFWSSFGGSKSRARGGISDPESGKAVPSERKINSGERNIEDYF